MENSKKTYEQKVRAISAYKNITINDIATEFGITQSSFISRLKCGKLKISEKNKIAEILGCKFIIKFVFEDVEYSEDNIKTLILKSCEHANLSQAELAKKLGKTKQSFNSRLSTGKFSDEEIEEIATKIGCKYVSYFELDNRSHL